MANRGNWSIAIGAAFLAAFSLTPSLAIAQESTPASLAGALDGAMVALYSGSCADLSDEPLAEVGTLEHRTVVPDPAASPTAGDAEPSRNVQLLGEDINGNGELDAGEDVNGNGLLDPGLLESEEMVPESALLISDIPEVWMLQGPASFEPFASGEGQALTIGHDGEIIACGELPGGAEADGDPVVTDPVFIDLAPVDGAGYRGFANFPRDSMEEGRGIAVVMFEVPSAEEDATPAP